MQPTLLEPDLLRVFVAVAERGGFTRAATALNRTQSAVSMQIKRLEEGVGAALFQRDGRKVRLSSAGESLIGYARRMLALNEEAVGAVRQHEVSGTVRLGCIDDYATRVLPAILAKFWEDHPRVLVEVETGLTTHLLDRLETEFDLVLGMQPVGVGRGKPICRDSPVWAASPDHDVHRQDPMPLALYRDGCLFRRWATSALDGAGRRWRCAYVSPSVATVEAAVENGLAVSVFKRSTVSPKLRRLGPREGFPRLPDVDITLHVPARAVSRQSAALADHLTRSLRAWHNR
jgi:DNA-binding transcriptional LysR family regulator